jgi:hypothetical protein
MMTFPTLEVLLMIVREKEKKRRKITNIVMHVKNEGKALILGQYVKNEEKALMREHK